MRLKERCFQRLYLLLAVMVLGQQFHVVFANNVLNMKEGLRSEESDENMFNDVADPNFKYAKKSREHKDIEEQHDFLKGKDEKSLSPFEEELKKEENSEQNKRGIHGVLFGLSVATSLINLGIDILLKVKGCRIFYPSIPKYTKEYNQRSRALSQQIKYLNQEWATVNALRDWVKYSNDRNAEIWIEVKRIGDLEDKIVKTLDPTIIQEFNIKARNIRKMVEAGNASVINMSYKEFDTLFQSSFTTVEDTALRLSSITGLLGAKIAAFGFKHYKLAKITKTLRTSYGMKLLKAGPGAKKFFGFSKASMNMHLKQTSKSMYKATFTGSRASRIMRGAGSVMSVVTIVMDIYSIIKKVKACRTVRDEAKQGVRQVKRAQHKARMFSIKLNRYKREVNIHGASFVKKQLNSDDLHVVLASIRDLSVGASSQSVDLRSAAPVITKFLNEIKQANHGKITLLQIQLISALKKVTIFLKCYLNKLKMAKYVQKYCQMGSGSIEVLFHRANRLLNFNGITCKTKNGFPYTTLDSVKALIANKAKENKFSTDCVLNNKYKKQRACILNGDGHKPQEIASKMKLKLYQVEHFLKSCGPLPVTPIKLRRICMLRQACAAESKIASLTGISQPRLLTVPCACSEI